MKVIIYQAYPFITDHYLLHAKLVNCTIADLLLVSYITNVHNESITVPVYILSIVRGPQQERV